MNSFFIINSVIFMVQIRINYFMHQLYTLQLRPLTRYTITTLSTFNKKCYIYPAFTPLLTNTFILMQTKWYCSTLALSLTTQKYQEHITVSTGEDESALDSVISLLEHTSELVNQFNNRMYINSTIDSRLKKF